MEYQIEIIRSSRKTMSLEVTKDGAVRVRCPYNMPVAQIRRFTEEKRGWIEKHVKLAEDRKKQAQQNPQQKQPLTEAQIHRLTELAGTVLPQKTAYYARLLGVTYGRIAIRHQKTRWGSCSAKGNLNFNCLLMLMPEEVVDYVVVHELCHRLQMNHSPQFWAEVEKVLPDYRQRRKKLKQLGLNII